METQSLSDLETNATFDLETTPKLKPSSSKLWFRISIGVSLVWGAALLIFFIYFLYDPSFKQKLLEFSRQYGSPSFRNIFIMVIAETLLLMIGISASVPEICYIFFLRNYLLTFCIAATARQLSTLLSYYIGRRLMHESMLEYMRSLEMYRSLVTLLALKPYRTIILVRFSMLPNFVKYYGLPILNPPLWKLSVSVLITTMIQAHLYLLPGYLAREESEISTGKFKSQWANMVIYICGVFYVIVFVVLGWLVKKEMKRAAQLNLNLQVQEVERVKCHSA